MPKNSSGSGPPRRSRARTEARSDDAPERNDQLSTRDVKGDPTEVGATASVEAPTSQFASGEASPAGMIVDLPARPHKAPRSRQYKLPVAPRFSIFIIDSGWNSVARRVLRHNFALIRRLHKEDLLYLLSRKKSVEFIRRHRSLIGRDPIIAVHDLKAVERDGTARFHGFHLHLGILRTPRQALMALQTFAQFVNTHRRSENLEAEIRSDLRREGMLGAVEMLLHKVPRALGR
jgi:hypothetical protein